MPVSAGLLVQGVTAARLVADAPTGDASDRIAGKDTRTGRIDWQQADLSGTGQTRRRPHMRREDVAFPYNHALTCISLGPGDPQFWALWRSDADRLEETDLPAARSNGPTDLGRAHPISLGARRTPPELGKER